jgi:multidrug efflux system membrane fusion protein
MTVENVPVTVINSLNELSVIEKGIQPGDKIVIDGQANLVSGGKIRIKKPGTERTGERRKRKRSISNSDNQGSN